MTGLMWLIFFKREYMLQEENKDTEQERDTGDIRRISGMRIRW